MWIRSKTPQDWAEADDHKAAPDPQVPVEAAARWIECCWPVCNQHQGTGQVRHYLRARGAQVLAVWDFLGFNDQASLAVILPSTVRGAYNSPGAAVHRKTLALGLGLRRSKLFRALT